jgi:threonine aldolase
VGSALAGDTETIKRAHRFRKAWGGGMRQVGILAAAALYALDNNLPKLGEDHDKARQLERAVGRCKGLRMARPVETNILIIEVTSPEDTPAALVEELGKAGVRSGVWTERTIRMVTHRDIGFDDIERTAELLMRIRG